MKLGGLQKLTLLDFPGHTACTLFTPGCNMRCPFCHNAPLVLYPQEQTLIPEEEVFAFLRKRRGLLDGVCITGGEPTLQADLGDFISAIRELGYKVKLDTNGLRPDVLEVLTGERKLDYIAMDIKSSPERYGEASGIKDIDLGAIERSIGIIKASGVEYEFRTTVSRELHDAETIEGAARMISGAAAYFIQCYKDIDEPVGGSHMTACSAQELSAMLEAAREYVPNTRLRGAEL